MKKVQILMTTYNGIKYLRTQLDSIIAQNYPNISILIRDDGSGDGTLELLEEYSLKYDIVSFYSGENRGVVSSNFDLIERADPLADYYSFSDQDDYWKVDKISRAVAILNKMDNNKPLLYCSRPTLVDKDLKVLKMKIEIPEIKPSIYNAVIENICIGCTAVINAVMIKMINENTPQKAAMHDWWFYLLASSFGSVYYDTVEGILYRQHSNNAVGARTNYYYETVVRLQKFKNSRAKCRLQIQEFFDLYYNELQLQGEFIKMLIESEYNMKYRFQLAKRRILYRQRQKDNVIFQLLLLLGLL